jgi:flagellar biosynthesis/type III secretory pathway chaperone
MSELLQGLVAILGAEMAGLRRILSMLRDEERARLDVDVARLGELAARKETLAHELTTLEAQRHRLVESLGAALGVRPERISLSALLRLLPEPPPGLVTLREELRGLLAEVSTLNRRNGFLLELSQRCLRGIMGDLVVACSEAVTYAPSGRRRPGAPTLQLVDRQA